MKNIIGLKNNHDENYYVNNQLTFEKQEEQRRFHMIKKENKERLDVDKATLTFKQGKLLINGERYRKKVIFPEVNEMVKPSQPEIIANLYQTKGELVGAGKCKFYGISQEVRNLEDVRNGYIKARRAHPGALHVVSAHNLPGGRFQNRDFDDCGEPGAGRALRNLLLSNNVTHRAVFIARYYGGSKIGPARFDAYRNVAISAISHSSYNCIVKKNQFPLNTDNKKDGRKPRQQSVNNKKDPATKENARAASVSGYQRAASPIPYSTSHGKTATPVHSPNNLQPVNPWTHATPASSEWADWNDNAPPTRSESYPSLVNKPISNKAPY